MAIFLDSLTPHYIHSKVIKKSKLKMTNRKKSKTRNIHKYVSVWENTDANTRWQFQLCVYLSAHCAFSYEKFRYRVVRPQNAHIKKVGIPNSTLPRELSVE